MDKKQEIGKLVCVLGGRDNISSYFKCDNGFKVNLLNTIDSSNLQDFENVLGFVEGNNQIQIIVDKNRANKIFKDFTDFILSRDKFEEEIFLREKIYNILRPMIFILGIFGLLLGINNLIKVKLSFLYNEFEVFGLISLILNSMFTIFPIIVSFLASKEFKVNPVLGVILGVLTTSQIFNKVNIFNIEFYNKRVSFLGIIFLFYVLGYFRVKLKQRINSELIGNFILFIIGMLMYVLIFQLIFGVLSKVIFEIFMIIYSFSKHIFSFLLGTLFIPLNIFGLYDNGFQIFQINQIKEYSYSTIFPVLVMGGVSQFACAVAIYLKNKKRDILYALPASFIGVGEGVIYGVNIFETRYFIKSCLCSGIGGLLVSLFDFKSVSISLSGFFSISGILDNGFYFMVLIFLVYIITIILIYFTKQLNN